MFSFQNELASFSFNMKKIQINGVKNKIIEITISFVKKDLKLDILETEIKTICVKKLMKDEMKIRIIIIKASSFPILVKYFNNLKLKNNVIINRLISVRNKVMPFIFIIITSWSILKIWKVNHSFQRFANMMILQKTW